ncbi:MAG: class I SAM-dependent methyltransferase [Deltaproteobacteria bacterium]|nr:class I SAM-dependent methyltransferase [Deltaproteobacteria bacterium]
MGSPLAWISLAGAVACLALRLAIGRRQVDVTGFFYVLAPLRTAAFRLRRWLPLPARRVRHDDEPKSGLFAYACSRVPTAAGPHEGDGARALEARERELRGRYQLGSLRGRSSRAVYRENLYVLDALDRFVDGTGLGPRVRALDVGSKDFRYAHALARWLAHASSTRSSRPREVSLTGIELEGHRVYADLHSRRDHGEAFAAEVDGADVTYRVGDFLEHDERDVDVVFMFFPFVLEYALVRWGLPRSYFLPERILAHARRCLRPGGLLVVMNHTEEEHARQLELCAAAGLEIVRSEPFASDLVDYAGELGERSITVARVPR